MIDDSKADGVVGLYEMVSLGPSVEADTEAVALQYPAHLGKGGLEPGSIIIVRRQQGEDYRKSKGKDMAASHKPWQQID